MHCHLQVPRGHARYSDGQLDFCKIPVLHLGGMTVNNDGDSGDLWNDDGDVCYMPISCRAESMESP